jgi:hypothetical protein
MDFYPIRIESHDALECGAPRRKKCGVQERIEALDGSLGFYETKNVYVETISA